jgi:general secretion pathway protein H
MISPADRAGASAGFTLIELLVVLAILALAAGMVMPVLGNTLRRSALHGALGEVRAGLRTAASVAIAEGRISVFRIDPSGRGYWIDRRFYTLAAADAPDAPRLAATGESKIAFYPWGGSSGGRVSIGDAGGRRAIAVDAVTGRAVPLP